MTKSNSIYYIVYCIALVFCNTYLTYSMHDRFWISIFSSMTGLFSGLFSFLVSWMTYGEIAFSIFNILSVLPIFVAGARNFSPPYSTFILFYFVSNIMASILWWFLGYSYSFGYGTLLDYPDLMLAIRIPILILHLNIIFSKNPIVKGIDNLAIKFKLPSSSGSSSLGDDLD